MTSPIKAEALGVGVTFDFDGDTYTIRPAAEWDLGALEAFEDQKIVTTVRLLLGPDQYAAFRAKPRTVGDLGELFAAMQRATVGGSGN